MINDYSEFNGEFSIMTYWSSDLPKHPNNVAPTSPPCRLLPGWLSRSLENGAYGPAIRNMHFQSTVYFYVATSHNPIQGQKTWKNKNANWLIGKEFEFCLIDTLHSNPNSSATLTFKSQQQEQKNPTDFAQGQGDWNCWRIDWICACSNQSKFAEVPLSLVCWLSKPPFFSHLKDAERMFAAKTCQSI